MWKESDFDFALGIHCSWSMQAGYGAGTGTLIARSMGDRAAIRSYELDCLVETTGDMSSCYRTGGHFFVLGYVVAAQTDCCSVMMS